MKYLSNRFHYDIEMVCLFLVVFYSFDTATAWETYLAVGKRTPLCITLNKTFVVFKTMCWITMLAPGYLTATK